MPSAAFLPRLGFAALLLYLFLLHSRILDLKLSTLHIPIVVLAFTLIACFLDGGFLRALTHPVGAWLALFTVWMTFAIPSSVWPGGSFGTLKNWVKAFLLYVIIAGLITEFGQLRRAVRLIAYSVLVLSLIAIVFGRMWAGRLILSNGRFTNPNDLAQILLMGFPFWWYIASDAHLTPFRRLCANAAMVPIFIAMAKTGSRGALIAALLVGIVLFVRSSITAKIQMLAGALMLVTLAAVMLPSVTRDRYFTFFQRDEPDPSQKGLIVSQAEVKEEKMEDSAVTSTYTRWHLFKDSLILSALHPLFGVGPGQFDVAQDLYSRAARGRKGVWQVTHNTFTQVSSESGLPALLFYVAALICAFRAAKIPAWKRQQLPRVTLEVDALSFALRLSLAAYVLSAMFASFAYQSQLPTLAGLAVVFARTAAIEMSKAYAPQPRHVPMAAGHPVLSLPRRAKRFIWHSPAPARGQAARNGKQVRARPSQREIA